VLNISEQLQPINGLFVLHPNQLTMIIQFNP